MKEMTVEMSVFDAILHIVVPKNQINGIENLKSPLHLKLEKKRKKRSLSANAYMWVLCSKIAEKLKLSKEEVYRHEIRSAGKWTVFSEVAGVSLEEMADEWRKRGIGYQAELMDGLTADGHRQMIFYLGSSAYSTDEMSRLLDVIISDAEDQGIETITPAEKAVMMEEFENAKR